MKYIKGFFRIIFSPIHFIYTLLRGIRSDFKQYSSISKSVFWIGLSISSIAIFDLIIAFSKPDSIEDWFVKIAEFLTIWGVGLSILVIVDNSSAQTKSNKRINEFQNEINTIMKKLDEIIESEKIQEERYKKLLNQIKKERK